MYNDAVMNIFKRCQVPPLTISRLLEDNLLYIDGILYNCFPQYMPV